jgi:LysM repeat protein
MESLRQIGAGILLGILSILILLGGFSLAMAEGGMVPAALVPASATPTSPVSIIVTIFPTSPLPTSAAPASTDTPAATLTATVSLTPPPTLTICQPPAGWVAIIVQSTDTLVSLSQVYRTSVDLLRTKNCLLNDQLVSGSILYVPPLPTSTVIPCGPPANWGTYTVAPGDTLYRISLLYRVTVQQLMQANCLRTSNINAGQLLRVPRVPTSTPAASDTPFPTLTDVPSLTPVPTTEVPSPTTEASPTNTPVPTATDAGPAENP